jgi:hypothetical protein
MRVSDIKRPSITQMTESNVAYLHVTVILRWSNIIILWPYKALTMSRAPGLHEGALLFARITATLDYVLTRGVWGHRDVRDERVIVATALPIYSHDHLYQKKSCKVKVIEERTSDTGEMELNTRIISNSKDVMKLEDNKGNGDIIIKPDDRQSMFRIPLWTSAKTEKERKKEFNCRSQWPCGLRHVLSSTARTSGSRVRMCVHVFLCCVVLCR